MRKSACAAVAVLFLAAGSANAQFEQRSATDLLTGVSPSSVTSLNSVSPSNAFRGPLSALRSGSTFRIGNFMNLFSRIGNTLKLPPRGITTGIPSGFGFDSSPRTTADLPTFRIR